MNLNQEGIRNAIVAMVQTSKKGGDEWAQMSAAIEAYLRTEGKKPAKPKKPAPLMFSKPIIDDPTMAQGLRSWTRSALSERTGWRYIIETSERNKGAVAHVLYAIAPGTTEKLHLCSYRGYRMRQVVVEARAHDNRQESL